MGLNSSATEKGTPDMEAIDSNRDMAAAASKRGIAARVAIMTLNFVNPGLGLVRLGSIRTGLLLMAVPIALFALLLAFYAVTPTLTATGYFTIIVLLFAGVIVVLGVASFMTWRTSAMRISRPGWLWRWYGLIGIHLCYSLVLLALAPMLRKQYSPFFSPTESMLPTIELGDQFVSQMRGFDPLRRGDLVIVRVGAVDYVKRIAGLPGDRIAMRAGTVVLNGQPVAQRRVGSRRIAASESEPAFDAFVLEEQFPGEARAHRVLDFGARPQDDWAGATLGPRTYAVLGDSRDNTLDSRFALNEGGTGLITRDRIRGKALFGYWRRSRGFGGFAL